MDRSRRASRQFRKTIAICACVLSALAAGQARAESYFAKAKNVPTDKHPYLFFTAEDLPEIKQRSSNGPAASFTHWLTRTCVKAGKPDDEEAVGLWAFYGMLAGGKQYTDAAKSGLLKYAGDKSIFGGGFRMQQGGSLRRMAIAYDLLYNDLSDAERKKVEEYITAGATYLYEGGKGGNLHWSGRRQRLGNWRPQMYSGIGISGLVLWNTHPDAKKWVGAASDIMKDVLEYDFDPDGAGYEAYERYFLNVVYHSMIPTLEALRRVTGEDLFSNNNKVLYRTVPFLAYSLQPDRDTLSSIGDSNNGIWPVGLCLITAVREFDDPLAAWYIEALIKDGKYWGDNEAIWGVLWAKPASTENPETSGRLSEAIAYNKNPQDPVKFGSGHVFLRTGFTGLEDIYLMAQAGEMGGFHGHADKGSYVLDAYGVRFLRDFFTGGYEGSPFFKFHHSGEAHQTVLIDGEGQGAEMITPGADPYYHTKVADVEALEVNKGYDYIRLNTKRIYQLNPANASVQRAYRHIVFVRTTPKTGYFVVLDDIQRDSKPHTFSHPFHYDPQQVQAEMSGNKLVLSNPKASLHIAIVQPQGEFKAQRKTTDSDSYVILTCPEQMVRCLLVTVLYPVQRSGAPPAFEPVNEGEGVGVQISGVKIAMNSNGAVSVEGSLSGVVARRGADTSVPGGAGAATPSSDGESPWAKLRKAQMGEAAGETKAPEAKEPEKPQEPKKEEPKKEEPKKEEPKKEAPQETMPDNLSPWEKLRWLKTHGAAKE